MHRQLRAFNNEVPASPERMDPVLRLLMQLYADQLERIDRRVDQVWDNASRSLIRAMCPESMRWPVPAYTVMHCEPTDPLVVLDPHVKFFYREKRERGQTFFFSPLRSDKLIAAQIKKVYLRIDNNLVDLSPTSAKEMSSASRMRVSFGGGNLYRIYVGIDYTGQPIDLAGTTVFLKGAADVLRQLRWGKWYPSSNFGSFYEDSGFCPGLSGSYDCLFAAEGRYFDWGGLRNSLELFKPLENNFVILPEFFAATWEMGPPDTGLAGLAAAEGIRTLDDSEHLYWLRIDPAPGGDKSRLQSVFEFHFNCFIAVNKNELTLFKHTGGNRLVEVELPEEITHILEITGVTDSMGREYVPRHLAGEAAEARFYTTEEKDNHLILWFDFSSPVEMPPDSITVNYSITAGTEANGIEAGKIVELYEHHPGIASAANIMATAGAIPAKTEGQIVDELAARLRNRDRSLSFAGIARWARTFDPRIIRAECENGVERMAQGVRRCIIIRVYVQGQQFYSEEEINLLRERLAAFLKSRSPVNTAYRVEVIAG